MALLDRIKGIFTGEKRGANISLENPSVSIGDVLAEGLFSTDIIVNEATILSIPAVKRAIGVIASTIAGLPVNVMQKQEGGYLENINDHSLKYLLNYEPNAINDKVVFYETLITNLLIHGNGFAIIDRDRNTYAVDSLRLLHPDIVTVKVLRNGNIRYEINQLGGSKKFYRPDEIIHLQGSTTNGFLGFSTIDLNRSIFELALHTINFGKAYYQNGGFLSGVIKHPSSLSDSAHKRLKNSLSRYSGSGKAGKQLILDEGMTYETLTISPAQAGFVEVNNYLIGEFSRIFGVPPFLLQDLSKSTMQNVESLNLAFVKHTVIEHLNKLESEFSRKLLTEADKMAGYCIKLNLDDLLKADSKTRGEYLRNLFNIGAVNIDEIRMMEGLVPLNTDGSKKHFVQINMGDIENDNLANKNTNEERNLQAKKECDCLGYVDDSDYYDDVEERNAKTYNDYPDSVVNNAKRGIKLNEAVNNKCATQVGKVRARQLANREPLTMSTIKRMYSYLSRAEEYYNPGDTKACGTISYLLWGGKSAKSWAASKIKDNE